MQQFLTALIYILLAVTSLFLICLVLIQRGKGGGLAGALGGQGGSSAFGTKAGDVFTRVTMISAGVWIALNMLLVVITNRRASAWPSTTTSPGKSEFTPAKIDLEKSGTPGDRKNVVPGVPDPKEKKESGGTSLAPLPPTGVPPISPPPAPLPAPK